MTKGSRRRVALEERLGLGLHENFDDALHLTDCLDCVHDLQSTRHGVPADFPSLGPFVCGVVMIGVKDGPRITVFVQDRS